MFSSAQFLTLTPPISPFLYRFTLLVTNRAFIATIRRRSLTCRSFLPSHTSKSSFFVLLGRESFDIQMTRCYIRLLPDVPFVMFYEESGVEYWMAQFFDSTGSETTTILDNHSFHPMDALPKIAQPLFTPAPSESVSCRSLFVLSSSSPSLPFHTLLQQDAHSTFLAVSTT